VILEDEGLTIESNGETVGVWSLSDVTANRTSSDQFAMSFGDERMMFEAEDTLSFSYEALPHIDGRPTRSGVLTKLKTAFTGSEARPTTSIMPPPTPIAVPPPEESIDLRDDRRLEVISFQPSIEPASKAPADHDPFHCRGVRRDGDACHSTILLSSGFCSSHDPAYRNRPKPQPPVEDPALAIVYRHLERAVRDVRAGRMEPKVATAIANLAQAMCATIDADETVQDTPGSNRGYLRRAT
jgi:hypothetical protein